MAQKVAGTKPAEVTQKAATPATEMVDKSKLVELVMNEDEQAQKKQKEKAETETLEVVDVAVPLPEALKTLEPLTLPPAKKSRVNETRKTEASIAKAYKRTGMAAKDVLPDESEGDFQEVRGRGTVKREARKQRRTRSLSTSRARTPPPQQKRPHNQAIKG